MIRQDPHLLTDQTVLAGDRTDTSSVWKEEFPLPLDLAKERKDTRHTPPSQSVEPTWKEASGEHSTNSTLGQERLHHFQVLNVLSWSQKINAKQVVYPKKLHRSTSIQLSFPVQSRRRAQPQYSDDEHKCNSQSSGVYFQKHLQSFFLPVA